MVSAGLEFLFRRRQLGADMRRFSVALITFAACTQLAFAADMPVKAPAAKPVPHIPYDWSGPYIGGHVGYLWGRTSVEEDGVVTEPNASTNGVIGGVLALQLADRSLGLRS
jgi:opacity protein-like surface antigen